MCLICHTAGFRNPLNVFKLKFPHLIRKGPNYMMCIKGGLSTLSYDQDSWVGNNKRLTEKSTMALSNYVLWM